MNNEDGNKRKKNNVGRIPLLYTFITDPIISKAKRFRN